jgi:Holliday junction resolvasome RuvABC endonuclease subunit
MGESNGKAKALTAVFPEGDPDGSKARKVWDEMMGRDKPCYCGLDLSLVASGVCVRRGGAFVTETVRTKPEDFPNDLARMIHIRDVVTKRIPDDAKMVGIEDMFAGPNMGAGQRLAMLGAIVRVALYERGLSLVVIAPSTLKKFILGKGVGEKSLVLRAVYKAYGLECANDNEADAVCLCAIGEQFFGALRGGSMEGVPKYQQEVVKKLMETREERGFNLPELGQWLRTGAPFPLC